MAAILPFLETEPDSDSVEREMLGDFDPAALRDIAPEDVLSKSHTELTRLAWARSLIANALADKAFEVEDDSGVIYVRILPGVPENIVPWHKAGHPLNRFSLFSTNEKMEVPTWDLPSGVHRLGGSCPGARWAQTSVAADESRLDASTSQYAARVIERAPGVAPGLDPSSAICQYCYASGGKYSEVQVQFNEVARLAFIRAMMATPEGTEKLTSLLAWTITRKLRWAPVTKDPSMRHGLKPVRVHSSGDFFDVDYAELWMDVARRVQEDDPAVRFWAPTRTHVLASFAKFWATPGRVPANFIVRPSAYHLGDPAPRAEGLAKGTSVLSEKDTLGDLQKGDKTSTSDGSRFDWQCGVYALGKGDKTCAHAVAPDGQVGCRACWKNPDIAVNYTVH